MATQPSPKPHRPFRRAVLRGIGVILPPLLTIVFLLWIWNSVQSSVLRPIESQVHKLLVRQVSEVYDRPPSEAQALETSPAGQRSFNLHGEQFVELPAGQWIPSRVVREVRRSPGETTLATARAYFDRYVEIRWIRPSVVWPIVFSVFILLVYLLGKFIAARVGRLVMAYFERLINQLPFIRSVYGTFKQVTDVAFSDQELEFSRAVAIQYPRLGLWSVGFVTGESMPRLAQAAGEPVFSVLMPTSPAPFTGFTITVRKSEVIELDISRDQALQFVVSCGVVVPGSQGPFVKQSIRDAVTTPNEPSPADIQGPLPAASLPTATDSTR